MNTTPDLQDVPAKVPDQTRLRIWLFVVAGAILVLAFLGSLADLVRFSLHNELFSHIVLIPFVTGYLIWIKRGSSEFAGRPNRWLGGGLLIAGVGVLASYMISVGDDRSMVEQDRLCLKAFAFVLLFIGLTATFLDWKRFRRIAFPLAFLIFMVPLPVAWVDVIESFLQHRSASAAAVFFGSYGTPFFRDQTYFQLPGINLQVAPECSGIRSSLALLITSIVAGYLFLQSPVKRAVLALAVIPLAIVRNGFRVFIIGELCIHIGPEMIDSYIHRHGGPIFFALSLIPFFLILWLLIKMDRRGRIVPKTEMAMAPESTNH